jgi:hypothetical protein
MAMVRTVLGARWISETNLVAKVLEVKLAVLASRPLTCREYLI